MHILCQVVNGKVVLSDGNRGGVVGLRGVQLDDGSERIKAATLPATALRVEPRVVVGAAREGEAVEEWAAIQVDRLSQCIRSSTGIRRCDESRERDSIAPDPVSIERNALVVNP